ncbi:hydrogenase expression/formation protein HypE [Robertkochia aurantiaca]|uniref:hydrogenase expression/formation protein HypE n=1 Tax=Robertkochia aurantiaca TaxID=2873700 RepID=UPI001CC99D6B|nr:hydrogenase expression/formation protein HypE [Robertkochia sp. 3YJGBD-33]
MKNKDHITIAHGSGGVLSRELLDEYVFAAFSNPYIDQKHDGAVVPVDGQLVISTDSFVIDPIFFKGGDIGELSVNGTVNDVAMCGGIPAYLSLSFIIEEGLALADLKKIICSIRKAAERAGVQIVTGDTKVVEKGKGDKIFINTTGVGTLHLKADIRLQRVRPGDRIVINAPVAAHGMAIMSQREGLTFESDIVSDTQNLNKMVEVMLDRFGEEIHLLRDATRGGLAGVLNEVAEDRNIGIHINEEAVPIDSQVAAACELLGIDPLYVANEGVFMAVVSESVAKEVVELLRKEFHQTESGVIGECTESHTGKVVLNSHLGGKRFIYPQIGEQLPRIC